MPTIWNKECVCSKTTTAHQKVMYQKFMDVSYIFIAVEINIMYRNVCMLYRNVHILFIQYMYTLQVCISAPLWGCQHLSPRKYSFKWEFCVPSLQECYHGIKQDLPDTRTKTIIFGKKNFAGKIILSHKGWISGHVIGVSTQSHIKIKQVQDTQHMYNIINRCFCITIVAVEKQLSIIQSGCVCL